jgi:hypothetical protein
MRSALLIGLLGILACNHEPACNPAGHFRADVSFGDGSVEVAPSGRAFTVRVIGKGVETATAAWDPARRELSFALGGRTQTCRFSDCHHVRCQAPGMQAWDWSR